jgi:hypothetical protein
VTRWLPVLAVMASVGLLAACSDDDDGATATSAPSTTAPSTTVTTAAPPEVGGVDRDDPCTLLTAEEASALVGVDIPAGFSQPFEDGVACVYIVSSTFVGVQVLSGPGTPEALAANAPQLAADAVPIEGVGEAAFISDEEASLAVLQDGLIFSVTLAVDGAPAPRELVLRAADLVLARLG